MQFDRPDSTDSTRRALLKSAAAGVIAAGWAAAADAAGAEQPASPSNAPAGPQLAVYPFGNNIWVRVNDRPFTCYRANADQKGPYFYPVLGPATGLPMTEEASEPYPHHRSLFFGCDRVNGGNYWQEGNNRGQILSRGPKGELSGDKTRVTIVDSCDWRQPGKDAIIEDRRRFVIAAPSADLRTYDADITLTAVENIDIRKTNHSLFAIRCARELAPVGGGELINSEGQSGEKATFGKPARWCGFQGKRFDLAESIVLLDHPQNPWGPKCPWFTRDYGNISPTPFNWLDDKGWQLPKGESIRLRYRVLIQKGAIERSAVDAQWDAFAKA